MSWCVGLRIPKHTCYRLAFNEHYLSWLLPLTDSLLITVVNHILA